MADTYYAWTRILAGEAKEDQEVPGKTKTINYGDKVTASDLGGDEQFDEYLDSGAVRDFKPPKLPDGYQGSPLDFLLGEREKQEEAAKATTGGSHVAPSMEEVLLGAVETDDEGLLTQADTQSDKSTSEKK